MTGLAPGLTGVCALLLLLVMGMPIGIALGLVGMVGLAFTLGFEPMLVKSAVLFFETVTRYELGTLPVNFMADLDITGGNSGSPVMDARGELVGLVFDMNWEAVVSNWVFDPEMTRVIAMDSRYMLWILDEVLPAPRLMAELEAANEDND